MAKKIQLYERDQNSFTALSKLGHVPIERFKEEFNIADNRIKTWIREGLAIKVAYRVGKEVKESLKLTPKAERMAEKVWGLKHHYNAQNPYHDHQLTLKYFSLSAVQRSQWKTETEVRQRFFGYLNELQKQGREELAERYEELYKSGLISMPDAVYTSEQGVEVAYECVTSSYTAESILSKMTTCEIMNYQFESTNIR
jgi:hypothetical protein